MNLTGVLGFLKAIKRVLDWASFNELVKCLLIDGENNQLPALRAKSGMTASSSYAYIDACIFSSKLNLQEFSVALTILFACMQNL